MEFLKKDLDNLFNDRGVDKSQYDKEVNFMDPITKYSSISGEFTHVLLCLPCLISRRLPG